MTNTIKPLVRGIYDLQKLRIQIGGRLAANFRSKLGIEPGQKEITDQDAQKILKNLKIHYKKMTDGITQMKYIKFKSDGVISNMAELVLIEQYINLETQEKGYFKSLEKTLTGHPLYDQFLSGIRGIGAAMAGVIISEIDISRAKYPSSLWKYAGLDVVSGVGRSRKKEHLVEAEYDDKNGERKTKVGISYNPFLKTKLTGVLGSSFLRAGGHYKEIYDDYKNRITNHEKHKDKTKLHLHNMAIRYMVKMFLLDLYKAWREIEGLPVTPSYQETKLQHEHGKD